MCKAASFVLTKKQVYWGWRTESHEQIVRDHNLRDVNVRGETTLVRCEIVPPESNYALPLSKWMYHLDYAYPVPPWYDATTVERRARVALRDWAKAKLLRSGTRTVLTIADASLIVCGCGTVQQVCNGGTVQKLCDGGTVQKVLDGGTVQKVWGGTVQQVFCGTVQEVLGGTVQTYTPLSPSILKSSSAILIDRSGDVPVCHVGKAG
jgi:hypothetical protein